MADAITSVGVVIPAFNEADSIEACLTAVARAVAAVAPVPVRVVVVTNGSSDATAELAQAHGAEIIVGARCPVGTARDLGMRRLIGPTGLWLATTDADSVVPESWLVDQVGCGADVFVGTVALTAIDRSRHPDWARAYGSQVSGTVHTHVHGANLGMRADWYVAVGGFAPLACHEDRQLVELLAAAGAQVLRTTTCAVVTSARHSSRVEGGVASDLATSE